MSVVALFLAVAATLSVFGLQSIRIPGAHQPSSHVEHVQHGVLVSLTVIRWENGP